jgi:hypothetical protein
MATCNLYRITTGVAEVATLFDAPLPAFSSNAPEEIYPGYPDLVVREADGARVVPPREPQNEGDNGAAWEEARERQICVP